MSGKVSVQYHGNIAVITIDNPPINAGSLGVRKGLLAAIEVVESDASIEAAVLIGSGSTFVAGSDLREFGMPLEFPQLPGVISAIERCTKPFVAALHGAALGGGFELALGCDARIASPGTKVGLPEVTLGIVPGAGGTQRLPRAVGIAKAIQMICSGERVGAEDAMALGLIDEVTSLDLKVEAIRLAGKMTGKRRLRDVEVPRGEVNEVECAVAAALRVGRSRPAVCAAIELVKFAERLPLDEALAREREKFQDLRLSYDAFALRHQFFSERQAVKPISADKLQVRTIDSVAVIGAGTMGSGIAICALKAGFSVTLLEQDEVALERGRARIDDYFAERVKTGKLAKSDANLLQDRLLATQDWNRLGTVDIVIEAVFEDLDVKRAVFRKIDQFARNGAILATNTSYLDIDDIAEVTERPQDVIGLHFFSPAHLMRLTEVVNGRHSAADAIETGVKIARKLGKLPVVSGNAFGFIGNRIYAAYRRQCEFMIEEGAYPEQVDSALTSFGFAMGPFAVADLSGLDIAWNMRKKLAPTRDPSARYVDIPDRLCELGRLGRKSGKGYYLYREGDTNPTPDTEVRRLIDLARVEKQVKVRKLSDGEIQRRALLSMVNEAALLLAERVARHATDVDVVLVNGYGFPRWEGGPIFWARERGEEMLKTDLDWLERVSGPGFVRGDARHLFGEH
ncbi:3-hydroxyacyl-CoA dehydrogenase NAD-binding domain-containing protein [Cupriavidus basilensis]|uniref:3-hydroxyacyl-CoA dehydrogenase NAD-binding domain-containing protein n=1 Tax=Cupriavidus basilensis TaxID=68895 RepID=UPI0039F658BE